MSWNDSGRGNRGGENIVLLITRNWLEQLAKGNVMIQTYEPGKTYRIENSATHLRYLNLQIKKVLPKSQKISSSKNSFACPRVVM